MLLMWIDTHCHLDAPEFDADRQAVREAARAVGVGLCVLPAVQRRDWPGVQALAAQRGVALSEPPEEPDNCCDSGCEAACVWETFYAEMGYWRDEGLLRLEDG